MPDDVAGAVDLAPLFGAPVRSSIDDAGDRDWFEFDGRGNVQIDLEGASSGQGTLADPVLRIFDAAGELLAQNDDGGAGFNARVTIESDETIFISAEGFGDGTGTYRLQISDAPRAAESVSDDDFSASASARGGAALDQLLVEPVIEPIS